MLSIFDSSLTPTDYEAHANMFYSSTINTPLNISDPGYVIDIYEMITMYNFYIDLITNNQNDFVGLDVNDTSI
jgi:hypothetical protein